MLPSCFKIVSAGIELAVHCTPNARQERIGDIVADADGNYALKIAVTVPPEDGKANKAVIALLSKNWKLPKTSISLLRGDTSRHKKLLIAGSHDKLSKILELWYDKRS
ncbi:MAG: DUF167 domain-containing protein [Alphaproteobacteria bacterium]|nr:MAG: DUF167 domain-containing protein [Alphaproteobacteria bacterium]